jgi:predicted outer membrane lipoprotein
MKPEKHPYMGGWMLGILFKLAAFGTLAALTVTALQAHH